MQFYSAFLINSLSKRGRNTRKSSVLIVFYGLRYPKFVFLDWCYRQNFSKRPWAATDSGTTPVSLKESTRTLQRYPMLGKKKVFWLEDTSFKFRYTSFKLYSFCIIMFVLFLSYFCIMITARVVPNQNMTKNAGNRALGGRRGPKFSKK